MNYMDSLKETAAARRLIGLQEFLPQPLKHRLMCMRRRRRWERSGVIFVHIPKAAGTSISHGLYGRSMGHMAAYEIRRSCPDLFARIPTFAVSRNPWDRLVSAFSFVRQGGTEDAGVWRASQYNAPSFRSFEAFVEEWLVGRDLGAVDHVFRRQAPYVTDQVGNVIVDYVGAVERLGEVATFLRERLGTAVEIAARNPSNRRKSYRSYYPSSRLVNLVGDAYGEDVRLFSYDF